MAKLQYDLNEVRRMQFDRAKFWWNFATMAKAGGILLGMLFVGGRLNPANAAIIIALISVASELIQMWSDELKGRAESLHRKLELRDGFGWDISGAEERETVADSPKGITDKAKIKAGRPVEGAYFASQADVGPYRALDNFLESAWWSKRLAKEVAIIYSVLSLALFSTLLFALIWLTANGVSLGADAWSSEVAARLATASVLLVFSTGLIKTAWGYWKFAWKAEQIVAKLEALRKDTDLTDTKAMKVIEEYHLARASAPMLPTWVWKMRQAKLNELWSNYQA